MGTRGATWETWTNIRSGFQEPEATLEAGVPLGSHPFPKVALRTCRGSRAGLLQGCCFCPNNAVSSVISALNVRCLLQWALLSEPWWGLLCATAFL